jgi:hypothetical protein
VALAFERASLQSRYRAPWWPQLGASPMPQASRTLAGLGILVPRCAMAARRAQRTAPPMPRARPISMRGEKTTCRCKCGWAKPGEGLPQHARILVRQTTLLQRLFSMNWHVPVHLRRPRSSQPPHDEGGRDRHTFKDGCPSRWQFEIRMTKDACRNLRCVFGGRVSPWSASASPLQQ